MSKFDDLHEFVLMVWDNQWVVGTTMMSRDELQASAYRAISAMSDDDVRRVVDEVGDMPLKRIKVACQELGVQGIFSKLTTDTLIDACKVSVIGQVQSAMVVKTLGEVLSLPGVRVLSVDGVAICDKASVSAVNHLSFYPGEKEVVTIGVSSDGGTSYRDFSVKAKVLMTMDNFNSDVCHTYKVEALDGTSSILEIGLVSKLYGNKSENSSESRELTIYGNTVKIAPIFSMDVIGELSSVLERVLATSSYNLSATDKMVNAMDMLRILLPDDADRLEKILRVAYILDEESEADIRKAVYSSDYGPIGSKLRKLIEAMLPTLSNQISARI